VIRNELCVEAENGAEGAFNLPRRVILRLELTDGRLDQLIQNRDVCRDGETDVE
jgi:hypothetical protein